MDYLRTVCLLCAACVILSGYISTFIAACNISIGLRKRYIQFLTWLFAYTSRKCSKRQWGWEDKILDESSDESEDPPNNQVIKTPTRNLSTRNILGGKRNWNDHLDGSDGKSLQNQLFEEINDDVIHFGTSGLEAIVSDDFTESQVFGELASWNLLTRTDPGYAFSSVGILLIWILGIIFRWGFALPSRLIVLFNSVAFLLVGSIVVSLVPEGKLRGYLDNKMCLTFFRIISTSLSLHVNYHNRENLPEKGSICVANHTSPFDMAVLSADNYYSLVGKRHSGFLGTLERGLGRFSQHIWFDTQHKQDREYTRKKLSEHANNGGPPILMFPEGVCVNNTTVLKFRKGCFEVGVPIYPVAMKYDRRFGDPFWAQDTWAESHLDLLTSWAVMVDVYYLPPMTRLESEDSSTFASRVQECIAKKVGLLNLSLDGILKYIPPGDGEMKKRQETYSHRARRFSGHKHMNNTIAEYNNVIITRL